MCPEGKPSLIYITPFIIQKLYELGGSDCCEILLLEKFHFCCSSKNLSSQETELYLLARLHTFDFGPLTLWFSVKCLKLIGWITMKSDYLLI